MCSQSILLEDLLQEIFRTVLRFCKDSYLVGGAIRDFLRGSNRITDLDIAVKADGFEIARALADALGARASFVPLDRDRRTARVVILRDPQIVIDISTLKGSTITEDLLNRDFTINAMAVHLVDAIHGRSSEAIIDPLLGRHDLEYGIIRMCSNNSVTDDPLRLLRAFRFMAQLGFSIHDETLLKIREFAKLVQNVSGERITDELAIILGVDRSSETVHEMADSSLLWELFPELIPMKGFRQNAFHHLDVWEHTLEALGNLEEIVQSLTCIFQGLSGNIQDYLYEEPVSNRPRIWLLKLAILFHDSGKPMSASMDTTGKIRFIGHERISKQIVALISGRIKLASRELLEVCLWVDGHMRPGILTAEKPSERAILRLCQRFGVNLIGLVLLYLADLAAARGPARKDMEYERARLGARHVVELTFKRKEFPVKPLLDGFDIMSLFGLTEGPQVGKIIKWLMTEQELGAVSTRQQAIEAVSRHITCAIGPHAHKGL